jgi:hypothetical protein
MYVKLTSIFLCLLLSVQSPWSFVPDICVYEDLKIDALRGKVEYTPSNLGIEPVANALVELRRNDSKGHVVAKMFTDVNGAFDLGKAKPGKYVIYVEAPKKLTSIFFPVELNKPSRLNGATASLKVILGFGAAGCRGSYAEYGGLKNFPK